MKIYHEPDIEILCFDENYYLRTENIDFGSGGGPGQDNIDVTGEEVSDDY